MRLSFLHNKVIRIRGDQSASLGVMRERLFMLGGVFILCFLVISVRVIDLSLTHGLSVTESEIFSSHEGSDTQKGAEIRRGYIYDRNGELLATSVKVPALFADPSLILEPEIVAAQLAEIFPDIKIDEIADAMRGTNKYTLLVRPVTPEQQARVLELGQLGLGFEYQYNRVYPNGSLVSHIVGYAGKDNTGLSGIELGQDEILAKGENVYLSLDLRLQHILRRELTKAMDEFRAVGAIGAILDIKTGEVLAGVSLPDFDPNYLARYEAEGEAHKKFNQLNLGVYELGSIFKVFSIAAFLDLKSGALGQRFNVRKPIKIGRFRINDYHPKKADLSIPEIFVHSSNIGTALMAEELGAEKLKGFYSDLGLLTRMKTEVAGSGLPQFPEKWPRSTLLTVSYGHGLSTTPLQVLSAFATVVNDGIVVKPSFLKKSKDKSDQEEVQVLSEVTSAKMRKLLRLNAIHGTGESADVSGFYVGGKTGTANKYGRDARVSSFAGVFPAHDPRYAIIIVVDEPKGHKGTYGYATAGWVAAPTFARVVKSMAVVLGLQPDGSKEAEEFAQDLVRYIPVEDQKVKKKERAQFVSY
ncbi:MAG: penicillin-binding protein 2 [Alphaproteobacteria bacterium]|nr:penicillin-binding protein 2 [Alphaproteobacteria bacterium]